MDGIWKEKLKEKRYWIVCVSIRPNICQPNKTMYRFKTAREWVINDRMFTLFSMISHNASFTAQDIQGHEKHSYISVQVCLCWYIQFIHLCRDIDALDIINFLPRHNIIQANSKIKSNYLRPVRLSVWKSKALSQLLPKAPDRKSLIQHIQTIRKQQAVWVEKHKQPFKIEQWLLMLSIKQVRKHIRIFDFFFKMQPPQTKQESFWMQK